MKFSFPPESRPLDGYTIKRAIHRGGFGEVYYALTDAGKEVALKLLNNNLDVELRGVSQCLNLKHPNLVTIFDIRTDADGDHWIIMEYVSGQGLARDIESHPGGMPIESVINWMQGMAEGLAFLHDRGIVHRDLKPANVYSENDVVKIGDVGLSKFISESRRSAQTQSVGTVYYMAPEVARGRYGREVDVYGLGVVLFEMLTGRVPFEGETTAEILMKHLSERPDLSSIAEPLRPVIERALEKDPQKRTADVQQLNREFREAVGLLPASARRVVQTVIPESRPARSHDVTPTIHEHPIRAARDKAAAVVQHHEHRLENAWNDRVPTAVKWTLGGLLFLILVRTGIFVFAFEMLLPAAIVGGIGYIIFHSWQGMRHRHASRRTRRQQRRAARAAARKPRSAPPVPPAPVAAARVVPPPASSSRPVTKRKPALTPNTERRISFRRRVMEMSSSMSLAVVCTAIITACLAVISQFLDEPAAVGLFAGTTLLASWSILAVGKLYEGSQIDGPVRRLGFLLIGAMVGAAAFGLDQTLMMNLPTRHDAGEFGPSLFAAVGHHRLLDGQNQPTIAAYVVFFAGLFGLRRWWWHADSFRKTRFRVSTALLTLLVGFLMTTIFQFPSVWGMMWALAISSVVQLSAAWVPNRDRAGMLS